MRPASELPKLFNTRAFTLGQGTAADLTLRRLLGADLIRPTRGVRLHSSLAAELLERAVAYQLAVPDGAISHITAAVVWGFWLPLESDVVRGRKAVVTPERTWCDLAAMARPDRT
ncbi:hypothetical protein IV500_01590 [Paeniglutamicibacter antarcticus]|uniref:Uncharacterized protein n=1 Tax=Arthrobacter terrae TaxID=2935737 RepID=A0A931CR75_9MICC|nr:hypothetical protein [Arthrobacter terrae]MBG0738128.1 hypothetical protein [Arthrobacter terrae]